MAYETGTATSVNDLLNKLATFCEANGWTRDALADEGTGRRWHAHRGSVFVNFRSHLSETLNSEIYQRGTLSSGLAFNLGTGYDGGVAWYKQAGVPTYSTSYQVAGISGVTSSVPAYHFFAHNSGDNIVAAVEVASGQYQWLIFGSAVKYGSYTGGVYFAASNRGCVTSSFGGGGFFQVSPSSYLPIASGRAFYTVDVDSETGWHVSQVTEESPTKRKVTDIHYAKFIRGVYNQPNTLNSLAILSPVIPYIYRDTTGSSNSGISPLGEIPKIFYVQIDNIVPSQQITLGSTNYRVFPFFQKGTTSIDFASGKTAYFGFAVEE